MRTIKSRPIPVADPIRDLQDEILDVAQIHIDSIRYTNSISKFFDLIDFADWEINKAVDVKLKRIGNDKKALRKFLKGLEGICI